MKLQPLFFSILLIFLSFILITQEAAAKRFGGGRSFGVQRSISSLFSPHSPQSNNAFSRKSATPHSWSGTLGKALLGGALAYLFLSHGLGAGILSWLLLGGILLFLFQYIQKKRQLSFSSIKSKPTHNQTTNPFYGNTCTKNRSSGLPAGFTEDEFLREAKVIFFRMQDAYDKKNMEDLSQFTAPEVFAEIQMQLKEHLDTASKTEVLRLQAALLDISKQVDSFIASVHFTGQIKEDADPITDLNEIWHFRQFAGTDTWVIGGIQQHTENTDRP